MEDPFTESAESRYGNLGETVATETWGKSRKSLKNLTTETWKGKVQKRNMEKVGSYGNLGIYGSENKMFFFSNCTSFVEDFQSLQC